MKKSLILALSLMPLAMHCSSKPPMLKRGCETMAYAFLTGPGKRYQLALAEHSKHSGSAEKQSKSLCKAIPTRIQPNQNKELQRYIIATAQGSFLANCLQRNFNENPRIGVPECQTLFQHYLNTQKQSGLTNIAGILNGK
jgi:hypothetical protein